MPLQVVSDGQIIKAEDLNQLINLLKGVDTYGVPVKLDEMANSDEYALVVCNNNGTTGKCLQVHDDAGNIMLEVNKTGVYLYKNEDTPTESIMIADEYHVTVTADEHYYALDVQQLDESDGMIFRCRDADGTVIFAVTKDGVTFNRQGTYYVTDPAYGAHGNGTDDDTVHIQAALTAAGAGETVYFPAGTYKITSALHVHNADIRVEGDGKALVFTDETGIVLFEVFTNRVCFRDLWVQGAITVGGGHETDTDSYGINFQDGLEDCRVDNCHFSQLHAGVRAMQHKDFHAAGNIMENVKWGFVLGNYAATVAAPGAGENVASQDKILLTTNGTAYADDGEFVYVVYADGTSEFLTIASHTSERLTCTTNLTGNITTGAKVIFCHTVTGDSYTIDKNNITCTISTATAARGIWLNYACHYVIAFNRVRGAGVSIHADHDIDEDFSRPSRSIISNDVDMSIIGGTYTAIAFNDVNYGNAPSGRATQYNAAIMNGRFSKVIGNIVRNYPCGVSRPAGLRSMLISGNSFVHCGHTPGTSRGIIDVPGVNTTVSMNLSIVDNTFYQSDIPDIWINGEVGGACAYEMHGVIVRGNNSYNCAQANIVIQKLVHSLIEGNILVDGCSAVANSDEASSFAIWEQDNNCCNVIRNNTIRYTTPGLKGYYQGISASLNSVIGDNVFHGLRNPATPVSCAGWVLGQQISNYIAAAPSGLLTHNATPDAGTWIIGTVVKNQPPVHEQPLGWVCTKSGTFGTLSAVTCNAVNGTKTLTCTGTITSVATGQHITVEHGAGGTTDLETVVVAVSGQTITIFDAVGGELTGMAVTWTVPTFLALDIVA
jgi:hypothetical protein